MIGTPTEDSQQQQSSGPFDGQRTCNIGRDLSISSNGLDLAVLVVVAVDLAPELDGHGDDVAGSQCDRYSSPQSENSSDLHLDVGYALVSIKAELLLGKSVYLPETFENP